ncbi:hypothetical protein EDD16DRAFT_1707110 [Pisolithus croceorrhizus]|nr:hypothetical protein EV401DRAFT_2084600 [Pisolithus croceorrhizus]KAI6098701.1 hypothetical protein F5141DRAFT_1219408 [Pisolithus sp. B1]KAI6118892.1 hypothetical protein EDD16DRAFT_1707110 [Pisolithus croceorrhizus]
MAVFHLLKAHLNPVAIDTLSGRVLPGWLHLYQNNMYVHLQSQLRTGLSPTQEPTAPKPSPPPIQPPHPNSTNPVSKLWEELWILHEKFYHFMSTHEACCTHGSNSHSTSSGPSTEDKDFPSHPATLTSPSPSLTAPQMVLSWSLTLPPGCLGPLSQELPPRTIFMIKLMYAGSPPLYLGVTRDNGLHTATTAAHAQVVTTIKLPADPSPHP